MVGRWKMVVVVLGICGQVADAWGTPATVVEPSPVATHTDATTRWSEKRHFKASYVSSPTPVPLLAVHAWTVTIADAAGAPVTDARLTVLGGMPEHAHGFPTTPQVKNLGGGRYLIEGLKFHMPGTWVVAFRIKAGTITDSVRFELVL